MIKLSGFEVEVDATIGGGSAEPEFEGFEISATSGGGTNRLLTQKKLVTIYEKQI